MIKVEKLQYDFEEATAEQLCSAIKVKRGGGAFFTSIALAAHGDDSRLPYPWMGRDMRPCSPSPLEGGIAAQVTPSLL